MNVVDGALLVYVKTKYVSPSFQKIIHITPISTSFQLLDVRSNESIKTITFCLICQILKICSGRPLYRFRMAVSLKRGHFIGNKAGL